MTLLNETHDSDASHQHPMFPASLDPYHNLYHMPDVFSLNELFTDFQDQQMNAYSCAAPESSLDMLDAATLQRLMQFDATADVAHMNPYHYSWMLPREGRESSQISPSTEYESDSPLDIHPESVNKDVQRNVRVQFTSPTMMKTGHAHTLLPPMVHPNPNDPSMQFNSETRTFNQRVPITHSSRADPYAASFLKEQLGPHKWDIFSSRLCERRQGSLSVKTKSHSRANSFGSGSMSRSSSPPDARASGATAIDFLVKVEIVKETLRTYVPHPYNPLKSLTHPFDGAPSGTVTLTRSTVLLLCGWSNTQFSYWARRAEAISVLARFDDRLRALGAALERRLRDENDPNYSRRTAVSSNQDEVMTGKGLDVIIDEVKKRTGASQFLRGKHSSLDPFGSTSSEADSGHGAYGLNGQFATAPVFSETFQALQYTHSPLMPPLSPSLARSRSDSSKPQRRAPRGDNARERESPETSNFIPAGRGATLSPGNYPRTPTSNEGNTLQTHNPTYSPRGINGHHDMDSTPIGRAIHLPVSDSRSEMEELSILRSLNLKRAPDVLIGSPRKKRGLTGF